jgi:hypothetical protein
MVEHSAPLLLSPHLWSLPLVGTAVLFRSGVVPRRWSFLKQWMVLVARKTKGRDPVAWFNVILFYVEISVVKRGYFLMKSDLFLKKRLAYPGRLSARRSSIPGQ